MGKFILARMKKEIVLAEITFRMEEETVGDIFEDEDGLFDFQIGDLVYVLYEFDAHEPQCIIYNPKNQESIVVAKRFLEFLDEDDIY